MAKQLLGKEVMQELHVALCEGRHEIPEAIHGSIFGTTIADPTDVQALEYEAADYLFAKLQEVGFGLEPVPEDERDRADDVEMLQVDGDAFTVNLYVTGLTVALIAVLNILRRVGVEDVVLWHYDRDSNSYYPQDIAWR